MIVTLAGIADAFCMDFYMELLFGVLCEGLMGDVGLYSIGLVAMFWGFM